MTALARGLALLPLLLTALTAQAEKPGPPMMLSARIVQTDAVTRTAQVEITAKALVKVDSIDIQYELPPGAAAVPGTAESVRDSTGRQTLTLRVALAPAAGQMVVKAVAQGKGIKFGAAVALDLPSAAPEKVKPEPAPDIIRTNTGEKLRIHKQP